MWTLLTTTVAAALADSINPIAIAQQMLLQSVSRKKKHIWGFIIGIAITNFTFGLIVYFGFADFIRSVFQFLSVRYPDFLAWVSLISEIFLLMYVGYSLYTKWLKNEKMDGLSDNKDRKNNKKIRNAGFWKLFGLGIVSCAMELTSALPYMTYIAFIIQANFSSAAIISMLIFYNIIFSLPLIVLYFASLYYERYFTRIYTRLMVLKMLLMSVFFSI